MVIPKFYHSYYYSHSLRSKNSLQPTGVQFTNTSHSTVNIEWRIPAISYTPETYHVEYGTSSTSLNLRSSSVQSGIDLTIANQIYSVVIRGLVSNTTYYYRVVASNSFSSTRSTLQSFDTVTLCMFALMLLLHIALLQYCML